jgi:hypothetical protein
VAIGVAPLVQSAKADQVPRVLLFALAVITNILKFNGPLRSN